MLEMVILDLKDLASSLKLLIFEAENLLEFAFSPPIIRALNAHSLRLNVSAPSSLRRELL